ncbi:snaclec 5-like [Actinia tenebrosa]|uniref:Snaclec 5-like n=1 Tax=Actinia tenebrosa TaxID=6105 RepID=A0A6P8ISF6_ACTTE|nr:snaclec 5-like [Actinia tenebrosa]
MLSYSGFFFVISFLMVNVSRRFACGFRPMTIQNYAVVSKQHLLVRFKISDWLKCITKCQNHVECLSYNYRHRQKRVEGALCELYKCGLDQSKDYKRSLYYSSGIFFQQLKVAEDGQYCKDFKTILPKQTCRTGWLSHGKSCYKAVNTLRTWEDANNNCQKMNSNLTSVLNQNQNDFIVSLSSGFDRDYFWIGLVKKNNAFTWQDGSSSTYVNWLPGEPSYYKSYDCVNIKKSDGKWKNWKCVTQNPSICKYDLATEDKFFR